MKLKKCISISIIFKIKHDFSSRFYSYMVIIYFKGIIEGLVYLFLFI